MSDARESGQDNEASVSSDSNQAGSNGPADEGVGPVAPQTADPADAEHPPRTDRAFGSHPPIGDVLGAPDNEQTPVSWRELIGVLCLIVVSDLAVYRGEGFAGYGLLFFAGPCLLWLGSPRRCRGPGLWLVGAMLVVLSAKMVWCGSAGLVAIGFALTVAFAMALAGFRPYVFEAIFFTAQIPHAGCLGIAGYGRQTNQLGAVVPQASWMSVVLPLLAFLAFGWIFVLANPDLAVTFGQRVQQAFEVLRDWVVRYSPDLLEVAFWFATLWIVLGLLRPRMDRSLSEELPEEKSRGNSAAPTEALLYPAVRNMLVTVIALFAVYLVFEFQTLWFREFPKKFHYSGYAHEGAAWLTVALALATAILSLVFQGGMLRDRRIRTLRRLAWLWSLENMILAVAVYHRLFIYINFNGMSRMRIVGLYGMSAVVVGFILVLWKIAHNRSFVWLVRRHLWTLAIAIYLLALTPLDTIVVSYNVGQILGGDPAPCVQISVHPINSEGILLLEPLLECRDAKIREGVRALLADHHLRAEGVVAPNAPSLSRRPEWARRSTHPTQTPQSRRAAVASAPRSADSTAEVSWTAYQISDRLALDWFRKNSQRWKQYTNSAPRHAAWDRFYDYAYQWY